MFTNNFRCGHAHIEIKRETIWALKNALVTGTEEHVKKLIDDSYGGNCNNSIGGEGFNSGSNVNTNNVNVSCLLILVYIMQFDHEHETVLTALEGIQEILNRCKTIFFE